MLESLPPRASLVRPRGIAEGKQVRGVAPVQKTHTQTTYAKTRRAEARMMKRLLPALLPFLLFNLSLPAAAAQSPEERQGNALAPDKRAAEEARAELERKALGLLREALEGAQELKLAENRVRAQVTAARLLWPRDAEAGREAFKA